MKVIIAGSRTFNDFKLLKSTCDSLLTLIDVHEIVSGCANGADKLGEQYAYENNIIIKKFPANWDVYGKSAGYIRNEEMAKYSDFLIAFWDGKSKGTMHMINLAKQYNLKVEVINYNQNV